MNHTPIRRSNAVPLTPERKAAFRRLLEEENAVTSEKGFFLRDPLLDVIVSVWPSEEKEGTFDVLVSAFQPGGKRVRLDGLRLCARGQDDVGTLLRIGHVTERGDLAINDLKAGVAFRLHSPDGISKPRERLRQAWAAQGTEASPAAQRMQMIESADGTVRGMLHFLSDGTAVVVFETTEARWADAMVRFALVQETGRVEYEGELRLEYVRDGLWEGRGPEGIRVTAATELVFEVQAQT